MILNFYSDLAKAKGAENIVRETFSQLASGYTFEDCSNDKECYYRGDIRAIAPDGREIYIEVKDDSRIHETHNVLCEYEVYYKESDYYGKGNMKSNYDIYCVVSQQERKIYVLDFSVLSKVYTKGYHKVIRHYDQDTYCYLCNISMLRKLGAVIDIVTY